jgi:hypothetical protein
MSSLSILRFFFGSQSPETSQKSKKYSSSEDRDKIRIIYNKIVYDRDVVIILLIKIRIDDIPLFDRISFKNVAVAKTLYVCLSNIKKFQYKEQIEQIIRSFLDHSRDFFNRWLSQFRTESTVNADLKLISQWSRKNQKSSYHHRSSSSKIERTSSTSNSSREYHRESPLSSLKFDTRLIRSDSSRKYHKDSSEKSRSRTKSTTSYRADRQKRDCHRSVQEESRHHRDQEESRLRHEQKNRYLEEDSRTETYNERSRFFANLTSQNSRLWQTVNLRDCHRSDQEESRYRTDQEKSRSRTTSDREKSRSMRAEYNRDLERISRFVVNLATSRRLRQTVNSLNFVHVSRENRKLLTVFNDSQSRSFWKNLIFAGSLWKNSISASSFWKDSVSARSRYDYDSEYCIQLFYLSENDLSENDYDLFWISEILLFSSRSCQILRISRILYFFFNILSSSLFIIPSLEGLDFFDPESCCETGSSQKGSESIRIGHIYIFLSR